MSRCRQGIWPKVNNEGTVIIATRSPDIGGSASMALWRPIYNQIRARSSPSGKRPWV
jgi:hypothetical protein